jgi:hypothetical protein
MLFSFNYKFIHLKKRYVTVFDNVINDMLTYTCRILYVMMIIYIQQSIKLEKKCNIRQIPKYNTN